MMLFEDIVIPLLIAIVVALTASHVFGLATWFTAVIATVFWLAALGVTILRR